MNRKTRGRHPITPSAVPAGNKRWLSVSAETMKTTNGKTRTPRRPARPIVIYRDGNEIARRNASSMRRALLEYNKQVLKPGGFTDPTVIGNTLTVTLKGHPVMFTAKEVYQ